ncbi:hypothetical protein [Clostridium sp. C105KSO13]|uniref:hypothetical protein n=1 Tax=Clostridium sp. C105KSO13 TaxID=1776045 RepID=UPI0007405D5C|nr:hypothetical protein [Clostridium sp. C105KSO13]CUX25148.1 hypothetical protein BN3456_00791 [Clostridium sp. C105KSO13]
MQLKEHCNLEDFLKKTKECNSKVTFETSEGDILAMQSTLCQFIFVSLRHQPALLYGGKIQCEDENDYEVLKEFLH